MQMAGALAAGLFFTAFSMPVPMGQPAIGEDPFRPVYHGGTGSGLCGPAGEIAGPAGLGNTVFAVRNGPDESFRSIDYLSNGERIWQCDGTGDWVGVVYVPAGKTGLDCTAAPRSARLPYTGPCRAGWIPRDWVRPVSG